MTGSLEVQAVGTGSGTTASTGLTPASIAEQQLLISVLAIEGPSNDPLGLWSNSFINGCTGCPGGVLGTTGNPAASNVALHVGYRTVSVNDQFMAAKTGLANRNCAMLVSSFPLQ